MRMTTDPPTTGAPTASTAHPVGDLKGDPQTEPQPWRSADDSKGWKVIARGQRRPGGAPAPLIRLTMALDAAQRDWLRQEAERTRLGYDEHMLKLLDDARGAAGAGTRPLPVGRRRQPPK